ncbi:hypothetical protein B296_00009462 [Ensete ventricosum]|uniref:Uncharacterized protein n=1 Tax=Ensete ventricosum TaxID=4639 RepID=A0A427BAJ5_ENSVE|nr:hypothetical protein B296_00009462 [Ensete ventricosum]
MLMGYGKVNYLIVEGGSRLSNYYLSPRAGFKINGASSYGKEWRSHFFIVDESEDQGFSVVWAMHTTDNALSVKSTYETKAPEKIQRFFSFEIVKLEGMEEPLAKISSYLGALISQLSRANTNLQAQERWPKEEKAAEVESQSCPNCWL